MNRKAKKVRALLAILLIGLAVAPLVVPQISPVDRAAAEQFFFERQESGLLAFFLIGFVVWNRRGSIRNHRAASSKVVSRGGVLALATVGGALICWSRLVEAADLYALGLILLGSSALLFWKSPRVLLDLRWAVVLALFVVPIPAVVYNEVVWAAQRLATDCAAWALQLFGIAAKSGSMLISLEQHDFWVIETCSGLRSAELLTMMAILIVEIAPRKSHWDWLLIVFAPVLALSLNVVRIVLIILHDSATANSSDHVLQGLAAVFVGTAILFIAQRMLPSTSAQSEEPVQSGESDAFASSRDSHDQRKEWSPKGIVILTVWVGAIVISWCIPSWPAQIRTAPNLARLALDGFGWNCSDIDPNRIFFNELPIGGSINRNCVEPGQSGRPDRVVDLYIATRSTLSERSSLLSSKFGWLGPDWDSARIGDVDLWQIGQRGTWYRGHHGAQSALVLVWRANASGPLSDAMRSALALDRVPGVQPEDTIVFRLATQIGSANREAAAVERAEKTLYRFLDDYADTLISIASEPK